MCGVLSHTLTCLHDVVCMYRMNVHKKKFYAVTCKYMCVYIVSITITSKDGQVPCVKCQYLPNKLQMHER